MPTVVGALLIVLVVPYVLSAGAAALGFFAVRRRPSPDAPDEWPPVTVVPARPADLESVRQALRSCDYPMDRIEVTHPDEDEPGAVENSPNSGRGDVVLTLPPKPKVPSGWIRSMVRHAPSDPSVTVGPTVIQHDDLFLPRLHALQHVGRLTVLGAASYGGLLLGPGTDNHAHDADGAEARESVVAAASPSAFNPDPDAAVARPPVNSFVDLLREQAEWFRRAIRTPSPLVLGQAVGLWLVHTVLLVCCVGAVAVPAWRQPTLVALLGKMGGDVLLTLPTASHLGQRRLLRSIVPTVLMLVLSIPLAGGWAIVGPTEERPGRDDPVGMES